jgi:hypothetical protein
VKISKFTRTELLEIRGMQCNHFSRYSGNLGAQFRNTYMWNPIHYAIYFRQYEALDYFFDDL